MNGRYKLVGHEPVPVDDLIEWATDFERGPRHVAHDQFEWGRVSTVFLGLDHSFGIGAKPVLFETMVFGGPLDGEQERYCTWDEAEEGHKEMLKRALTTIQFGV